MCYAPKQGGENEGGEEESEKGKNGEYFSHSFVLQCVNIIR